MKYGVRKFREELVNQSSADFKIGRWWDWAIRLVLVEAVVLIVWWFIQVRGEGWRAALDPFSAFSIGTVLVQWAIVLVAFLLLNKWLAGTARVSGAAPEAGSSEPIP